MRNNAIGTILAGMLCLLCLLPVWFVYRYVHARHALRDLAPQVQEMQPKVQTVVQIERGFTSLVAEALEYGKKNPDMNPVLNSLGITTSGQPAAAPPAKTAPKTNSK